MSIIKSFTGGLKKAADTKKTIAVVYLITLLLGLGIAIPFEGQLSNAAGNRMLVYSLLKDFDFTAYSDFMNFHKEMVKPFFSVITWFALFYLIFTVFFSGGLLKQFSSAETNPGIRNFFSGSAEFFFRFFRLAFYMLLLQIALFLPVALIFSSVYSAMQKTAAEPALFTLFVIWISVHFLLFLILVIISDFAKVRIANNNSEKIWREIWNSLSFVIRRIHRLLPLYIMIIMVFIAITAVYFGMDSLIGAYNNPTVLLMFVIQQIYIYFRLFIKAWILGSVYAFEKTQEPEITAEPEMEYIS